MFKEFFFAVMKGEDDNQDYSFGFTELGDAVDAVSRLRNEEGFDDAYIAVVDKSGEPKVIDELRDFYF